MLVCDTHKISFDIEAHDSFACKKEFAVAVANAGLAPLAEERSQFLTETEEAFFAQYAHPKRQHSFLLGRYAAKSVLSHFLGMQPKRFSIQNGLGGEPWVNPGQAFLTLAHSGDWGIALASGVGITFGIDLELKENIQKFFPFDKSCSNILIIKQLTGWNDTNCQGTLWTAQESLGKFFRTGLAIKEASLQLSKSSYMHDVLNLSYTDFPYVQTTVLQGEKMWVAISHLSLIKYDRPRLYGQLKPYLM